MSEKILLKDQLLSPQKVEHLAMLIQKGYPDFQASDFLKESTSIFPELELKERMYRVRDMLKKYILEEYETSVKILHAATKEETELLFIFMVLPDYIENYGCSAEYLDFSLKYLCEFTKIGSSEFAIRDFLNKFPEETYRVMLDCAQSDNYHVRRFASEGLRPKLPWAKAIDFDYKKWSEPLDYLFYDSQRYVTRSVANHLNDISKIDPDFVVQILKKWKDSRKQNEKEMNYIISHALRTAVKRWHPWTLEFLWYHCSPQIEIWELKLKNTHIALGESLEFSFSISALQDENLMMDYKIWYQSATGRKSEKVFKIKKTKLKKGETIQIEKKHPFKKMTTKKLYTGEHTLQLQINGTLYQKVTFYIDTTE